MVRTFQIELTWYDDDVIQLRITAANESFAGKTELYAGHESLQALADSLKGFPVGPEDRRVFEIGTFSDKCAGGGARMSFICTHSNGKAHLRLVLRAEGSDYSPDPEMVEFSLPIEANMIDNFIIQLREIKFNVGKCARLM